MPAFPVARCLCLAAAALLAACTKPNPLDCADGTCTDPDHPFCDVDGALGGQPKSCIAVACAPGAFQACRGDNVLRCNETGNDYDITQCEHGCDDASQGCVTCLSNAECTNPAPTCETSTHTCRACQADADCDSEVCDANGTCMDPSAIIYAAPDGSVAGDCGSQAKPCAFARAFPLFDSMRRTVKLRAGDYTSESTVSLSIAAGQTDYVDAVGATVHTTVNDAVFTIAGPGTLHLKGATFALVVGSHSNNVGVNCGDFASSTATHLAAEQLTFLGGGNHIGANNCEASISRSRFQGGLLANPLTVSRHSVLDLDRCWIETDASRPGKPIYTNDVTDPIGARIHVSNSIFVNTDDLFIPQGVVTSDHSTFINQANPVDCAIDTQGSDHGKRIYTNDLFVNTHNVTMARGTPCEFHYTLLYPQADTVPNGDHMLLNVDPKLVDVAHGDYHLSSVSPAIDAADPGSSPPFDYDGVPRPEGPRSDIGAFEFAAPQ